MFTIPSLSSGNLGEISPTTAETSSTGGSSSSSSSIMMAHPQDDNHDDPTLWIDIQPKPNSIRVQVPSILCDFCLFFYDWTFAAVDVWGDVLSAPPFPLETLRKVSIVLLGMERIRDNLEKSTMVVLMKAEVGNTVGAVALAAGAESTDAWSLASIPHYLIWGIPGLIALLSLSFVLTLQLSWTHQEEAVIATALILLIFLEALLPLFILGCTSMFLFQQVSWEQGLILLVIVWLGSTFCAHCLRRMLYQSLGHG